MLFQRELFTVDSSSLEVRLVSGVRESIKTVANLKTILGSEDIRFYKIDSRPIRKEYTKRAKYLLFYKSEGSSFTTSFVTSLEKNEEDSRKEE